MSPTYICVYLIVIHLHYQNAEFELHANQTQLDHMNNRGLQLLEDLKNIPNFDVSVLEQDLDSVNHNWETANATIDEHKENLEAQLICWDQVTSGKEELESWVNTMVTKLDDSLQHFDDAVSVEACLAKYKVCIAFSGLVLCSQIFRPPVPYIKYFRAWLFKNFLYLN